MTRQIRLGRWAALGIVVGLLTACSSEDTQLLESSNSTLKSDIGDDCFVEHTVGGRTYCYSPNDILRQEPPGDGESSGSCGNGKCQPGKSENCSTCPDDCGECPSTAECGNTLCEADETCGSCPGDCGECVVCGNGICQTGEDCRNCSSDCTSCPGTGLPPLPIACGDGTCDPTYEDATNCPGDCR